MKTQDLTDKKQIFNRLYIGDFDTRKRLNRSSKKINPEFIERLESEEVSSKEIKELAKSLPVFLYQTCITIHGTTETNAKRIGNYKNITVNKNGSLEIRYNAIDLKAKREISELSKKWKLYRSSADMYLYKVIAYTSDKEEAQSKYNNALKEWKTKQIKGVKAQVYFEAANIWGKIYISVVFRPLLIETTPEAIAMQLENETEQEFKDRIQQEQEEEAQRQNEINETVKRSKEQAQAREQAKNEAKNKIDHLPQVQKFEPNKTYIKAAADIKGNVFFFFITTGEKKAFGAMKYSRGKNKEITYPEEMQEHSKTIKPSGDSLGLYKPSEFRIFN